MGDKRMKLAKGLGHFVPVTISFTELEERYPHPSDSNNNSDTQYVPTDNGLEKERLEDNAIYEELVVQILCNLEEREKLVFMYQILRDNGYQIDHAAFAKTVKLSRRQYMRVLDNVRMKTYLYVKGYKNIPR